MKSDDVKAALMLAAAGAAAFVLWRTWRGAGNAVDTVASTVGGWVNPAADTNVVYSSINGVGAWLTGDVDYTLGGAIYDAGQAIASPQNPVYSTVSAIGQGVTGDQHWTLGGAIHDAMNPAPVFSGTAINSAVLDDIRRVEIASGGGGNFQGNGATGSW